MHISTGKYENSEKSVFYIGRAYRYELLKLFYICSFNNIHLLVQGTGEYDKLTQGLFENFLECKFKDPHMDGVSCKFEIVQGAIKVR